MSFDATNGLIWLDRSLGATKPKEVGIKYDLNMSIPDVEKLIKQKLGDKWRLPTDEELLNLFKYFETQDFETLDIFKDNEGYSGNAVEYFKLKDKEFYLKTLRRGNVTFSRPPMLDENGMFLPEYYNKPINYKSIATYYNNFNVNFLTKNRNNVYYKITYKTDHYDNFEKTAHLVNVQLAGTYPAGSSDINNSVYILPVKDVH